MNSVMKIVEAAKSRLDENSRDRREFKTRQSALFNEGLIQFKLHEQLQQEVAKMNMDPSISSIKVQISQDAIPFIDSIMHSLNCKVQKCPEPDEIILIRQEDYL